METRKTSEPQKRGDWLLGRDLVGHKWGKMEVIAQAEEPEGDKPLVRGTWWLCRCACGTEKVLPRQYITQESTKSCGCGRKKAAKVLEKQAPLPPKKEIATEKNGILSKMDRRNLQGLLKTSICRRCKKQFEMTGPGWRYQKNNNGSREIYCSWDCYRGKDTEKKMSLTERARLQSEAAGA